MAAGDPQQGFYSYELGAWHIVALNGNCPSIGGCQAGSMQEKWLQADLAAHPSQCTLAYWHQPRFSSGGHGGTDETLDLWRDLYAAGAEVILNGHDHNYERFAPQNPSGGIDPSTGIREFVVGTGGASKRGVSIDLAANSEKIILNEFGVLKLTLHPGSYEWLFIPEAGMTESDQGSAVCH